MPEEKVTADNTSGKNTLDRSFWSCDNFFPYVILF